jgi:hypothetical protein
MGFRSLSHAKVSMFNQLHDDVSFPEKLDLLAVARPYPHRQNIRGG